MTSKWNSRYIRKLSNQSAVVFVIKKVQYTVPWTYVIKDLNGEKIVGKFYEKQLQKAYQWEFRVDKAFKWKEFMFKWKDVKFYVKWKDYDNSFNSWIDKKDDQ